MRQLYYTVVFGLGANRCYTATVLCNKAYRKASTHFVNLYITDGDYLISRRSEVQSAPFTMHKPLAAQPSYAHFSVKVLELFRVVKLIPQGKVASYQAVGLVAGYGPRQVGYWLHHNPDGGEVPCHRVVRSDGKLAAGYVFGGTGKQAERLLGEGVKLVASKSSHSDMKVAKNAFVSAHHLAALAVV